MRLSELYARMWSPAGRATQNPLQKEPDAAVTAAYVLIPQNDDGQITTPIFYALTEDALVICKAVFTYTEEGTYESFSADVRRYPLKNLTLSKTTYAATFKPHFAFFAHSHSRTTLYFGNGGGLEEVTLPSPINEETQQLYDQFVAVVSSIST